MSEAERETPLTIHLPEDPFVLQVKHAVEAAFHDLVLGAERPIPDGFSLHIKKLDLPRSLLVTTRAESSEAGFGAFQDDSPAELIAKIASDLQDHLIEWFMIAAPVYPGTAIPLAARTRGNIAVWEHMTNPKLWSCPIGKYPGT